MRLVKKPMVMAAIAAMTIFFLSSCRENGSGSGKYPHDFPQECITAFDKRDSLVKQLRATGRFDEEALTKYENSRSLIELFNSPDRYKNTTREEYIAACNMTNDLVQYKINLLEGIKNIDSLSDEELQERMMIYTKNASR